MVTALEWLQRLLWSRRFNRARPRNYQDNMAQVLRSKRTGVCFGGRSRRQAYELVFCGGGVFGFWEVTLILVVPPVLLLLISGTRPALVSCAVLIPFILLANGAECAPYRGGGAAMGYVPALLFGMPLSFIAGVATAIRMFLKRRRLANAS